MLRGAKKNMIVVRTRDSRMFEEAYFVMRRNAGTTAADELDMLWEANRILESTLPPSAHESNRADKKLRPGILRGLLWYGIGLCSGGGLVGLIWLLV